MFTPKNLFFWAVAGIFLLICWPFLTALAMGGIFAIPFFPVVRGMGRFKISRVWASILVTLGVTVLFLLPTSFFIYWVANTGIEQLGLLKNLEGDNITEGITQTPFFLNFVEFVSQWIPLDTAQVLKTMEDLGKKLGLGLARILGNFFSNIPDLGVSFVIVVVSLLFFLIDGHRFIAFLKNRSVFSAAQTQKLLTHLEGMCRSVILATVVSAAAQAFIYSLACLAVEVHQIPIILFFVFFASFIPLVGSAPVTFGVALFHLLNASVGGGVFLIAIAIFVGLVDNVVRPVILKGAADLHPLLAFIAAFGGLKMMGMSGVFLGPIIAGTLVVLLQFYGGEKANPRES